MRVAGRRFPPLLGRDTVWLSLHLSLLTGALLTTDEVPTIQEEMPDGEGHRLALPACQAL